MRIITGVCRIKHEQKITDVYHMVNGCLFPVINSKNIKLKL